MNYNLSDLLEQKSFSELNAEEQAFVLTTTSAEEYAQRRQLILGLKNALQEEKAQLNPIFPVAALQELKAQSESKKKKGVWFIFAHKTPTWAAVAAGILLFLVFQRIGIGSSQNESLPIAQDADTIFVEKFVRSIQPLVLPEDTLIAVNSEKPSLEQRTNRHENTVKEEKKTPILYSDEMLNAGSINYTAFLSGYNSASGVSLQNDSLSQLVNTSVF